MKNLWGLVLLVFATTAMAVEVGGVGLPGKAEVSGQALLLNGSGLRKKYFVKVYAAGLYLPETTNDAGKAIAMQGPKRMFMQFIHDKVSAGKIRKGWTEGFKNNQTAEQMQALQLRLDDFNALFEDMTKDDQVTIDYLPGLGTRVDVMGRVKGTIPGEDFAQALFAVWLGDRPADKGLKKGLLGGQ